MGVQMGGMFSGLLCILAFFSLTSFADIGVKDYFFRLPRTSTVTPQTDILSLPPGGTYMPIGSYQGDADGDGVPDYHDWCLETPAGALVWKQKDVDDKKCDAQNVGCSGAVTEKWIYDATDKLKAPKGRSVSCGLVSLPSADDRRLPAKPALTVIDPRDASVTDDERKGLTSTTVGTARSPRTYSNVLVSTAGGTHFGLSCRSYYRYTYWYSSVITKTEAYITGSLDDFGEPTIEDLQRFAAVRIAKPVPIL
jgi:hypothetical protein